MTTGATASDPKLVEYQKGVADALNKVFDSDRTEELEVDLDDAKIVIFSDHHKGSRDGADDFRGCERAYAAALAYYLENGFRLFVLGDVEELWECSPEEVIKAYPEILALEKEFFTAGRYERFFGNHDLQWSDEGQVSKYLHRDFFPDLEVREAVKLRVIRGGEVLGLLFLVHGHQGTLDSDKIAWLSRPVVRHIWRPLQKKLNMRSTPPSRDFVLRQRHDTSMYNWARAHPAKPVLIAGHTHRPVFGTSQPPPKASEADLVGQLSARRAEGAPADELARLRAELEFVRAEIRENGPPASRNEVPCYFNTGCCSFGDGDVTGLEIAGGKIRLVRWPDDDDKPLLKELVPADLAGVLEQVRGAGPASGD
jgi:UDP-2,3-diacylglucosamine pyrophosphatase LpxH